MAMHSSSTESQLLPSQKARAKFAKKFKWPLWHFLVTVIISLLLTPMINAPFYYIFAFDKIRIAGYLILAVFYFSGWRRTGQRIPWAICLLAILTMPLLAAGLTGIIVDQMLTAAH